MGTLIQEDEGGDGIGIGIGINFYDDNGGSHRFSFQPEVASDTASIAGYLITLRHNDF